MTSAAAAKILAFRQAQTPPLSQLDLALRYGVSRWAVHGWEQLGKQPRLRIMLKLQEQGICSCEDWTLPATREQLAALDLAA